MNVDGLELKQNYPNPFSGFTEIRFVLPSSGHVVIRIYNALGQEIQILLDESKQSGGPFTAHFDGSNFPSGQYTYSLSYTSEEGESGKLTRKMYLVR
jgi:flagellar hook assembly protein FlgD